MSKVRYSAAAWLTSVVLIGGAACGSESSDRQNANSSSSDAPGDGTGAAADGRRYTNAGAAGESPTTDAGIKLEDAQISSVLSTINASELEQGNLASKRAQTDAVRGFANDVVASALAAQERLTGIATSNLRNSLDVGQAENSVAEKLQADARRTFSLLEKTHANRFDSLYLQSQVDLQRQVIVLIDQVLAPSVQNPLLSAEVQRIRGDSVVFLGRAQALTAAINLDSDGGVLDIDAGR